MCWDFLAKGIAAVHALWIAVFVLGPLGSFRFPRWRGAHLLLLWVTAGLWHFYCPLTVFENMLRARYDPTAPYVGGFLEHGLAPFLDVSRLGVPLAFGVWLWTLGWTAVYRVWWGREKRF